MTTLRTATALGLLGLLCGCFGATPRDDLSVSRVEVPGVSEIELPRPAWGVLIQASVVEGNESYLEAELDLDSRDDGAVVEMPFALEGVVATQVCIDAGEVPMFRDCLLDDPLMTTICSPSVFSLVDQSTMITIEDPTDAAGDVDFCFRGSMDEDGIVLDIGLPALETSVEVPDGGAVAILLPGNRADSMDAVLVLVQAELRSLR